MAAFSDLPNELLYDILQFTLPPDIENLAQTSRRVQEVAGPLLKTHRALIRKYYNFSNSLDGKSDVASLLLLQDIHTAPRIAHYVSEAQIDAYDLGRIGRWYTEEEVGWLCEMAAGSKAVIPDLNFAEVSLLQSDIRSNSRDAALSLLLPLLSNLKTLELQPWSHFRSWVRKVLCNASKAENPWFTKLTGVYLWSDRRLGTGYDAHPLWGGWLRDLRLCAALPSVRELSARNLSCLPPYKKSDTPPLASGVTTLKLEDMEDDLDPEGLCRLLKGFPRLEFCYLSTRSVVYHSWALDASMIKDILLATVKTSLRSLTIFWPDGQKGLMGSLRNFEVLVELRTTWPLLLQDDYSLQADLPASLHGLHLWDNDWSRKAKTYKKVVKAALLGNQTGLLHLKQITLMTPECNRLEEACRRLQQKCRKKDLILTFDCIPFWPRSWPTRQS